MAKAREFLDGARDLLELHGGAAQVSTRVTLLVHAGIAASDVVSCARTGFHPRGDSHAEALVARAAELA